jgi:hypothetical protein
MTLSTGLKISSRVVVTEADAESVRACRFPREVMPAR